MPQSRGSKLRVVHVASYFPSHTGGLEVAAWNIARSTAAKGISVDFFACGTPPDIGEVSTLAVHRVRFVDPVDRRFGLPMPIWSPRSISELARVVREAHVVHTHDTLYMSSVLSALLARWYRRPLLVTVHVSELRFGSRFLNWLFRAASHQVGRRILESASRVAFVGKTAASFHTGISRLATQPILIPNGVDRDCFRPLSGPDRRERRLSLGLPVDRPLFVFVGRFVEKKGLLLLRQAVSGLPGVQWAFVGDGPIHPEKWGLKNVRTPGRLDAERLAQYYQVADLVVTPGVGEGGITLVVQEAMSCGSPVLVSHEVADAFGDDRPAGVWPVNLDGQGAAANLCDELVRLAGRPGLLESAREPVARHAARWSWEATSDCYEREYRQLSGRVGGPIADGS
jgi:glycosyltransferase involved in cell wall biosynthesis